MADPSWSESSSFLRTLDTVPGSIATAELLDSAAAKWARTVESHTSMHDLVFTLPADTYPWRKEVRVSQTDGVFEFRLVIDRHLVTADRASTDKASTVLDAFLMQLAGTE
jgi:hypothetical protein